MIPAATDFTPWLSLVGGLVIGMSAVLLLLVEGRIAGISGIAAGAARAPDRGWRLLFLVGLVGTAFGLRWVQPGWFAVEVTGPLWLFAVAGLLVGIGTRVGNGCTSGHGVCGIGRLSPRSLVATLVFVLAGMVTVATARLIFAGAA